jgi:hypothetical protein
MELTQKIKKLYSEINWKLTSTLVTIPVASEFIVDGLFCPHKNPFDDHGDYILAGFGSLIMLGVGVYNSYNEVKKKKAEEATLRSKIRFKEFADMFPEAVFEINKDLNLTYANKKALELLLSLENTFPYFSMEMNKTTTEGSLKKA